MYSIESCLDSDSDPIEAPFRGVPRGQGCEPKKHFTTPSEIRLWKVINFFGYRFDIWVWMDFWKFEASFPPVLGIASAREGNLAAGVQVHIDLSISLVLKTFWREAAWCNSEVGVLLLLCTSLMLLNVGSR